MASKYLSVEVKRNINSVKKSVILDMLAMFAKPSSLADLHGKRVLVDLSVLMHHHAHCLRPARALIEDGNGELFADLVVGGVKSDVATMQSHGIHAIFVLDGLPNEDKLACDTSRQEARLLAKQNYFDQTFQGNKSTCMKRAVHLTPRVTVKVLELLHSMFDNDDEQRVFVAPFEADHQLVLLSQTLPDIYCVMTGDSDLLLGSSVNVFFLATVPKILPNHVVRPQSREHGILSAGFLYLLDANLSCEQVAALPASSLAASFLRTRHKHNKLALQLFASMHGSDYFPGYNGWSSKLCEAILAAFLDVTPFNEMSTSEVCESFFGLQRLQVLNGTQRVIAPISIAKQSFQHAFSAISNGLVLHGHAEVRLLRLSSSTPVFDNAVFNSCIQPFASRFFSGVPSEVANVLHLHENLCASALSLPSSPPLQPPLQPEPSAVTGSPSTPDGPSPKPPQVAAVSASEAACAAQLPAQPAPSHHYASLQHASPSSAPRASARLLGRDSGVTFSPFARQGPSVHIVDLCSPDHPSHVDEASSQPSHGHDISDGITDDEHLAVNTVVPDDDLQLDTDDCLQAAHKLQVTLPDHLSQQDDVPAIVHFVGDALQTRQDAGENVIAHIQASSDELLHDFFRQASSNSKLKSRQVFLLWLHKYTIVQTVARDVPPTADILKMEQFLLHNYQALHDSLPLVHQFYDSHNSHLKLWLQLFGFDDPSTWTTAYNHYAKLANHYLSFLSNCGVPEGQIARRDLLTTPCIVEGCPCPCIDRPTLGVGRNREDKKVTGKVLQHHMQHGATLLDEVLQTVFPSTGLNFFRAKCVTKIVVAAHKRDAKDGITPHQTPPCQFEWMQVVNELFLLYCGDRFRCVDIHNSPHDVSSKNLDLQLSHVVSMVCWVGGQRAGDIAGLLCSSFQCIPGYSPQSGYKCTLQGPKDDPTNKKYNTHEEKHFDEEGPTHFFHSQQGVCCHELLSGIPRDDLRQRILAFRSLPSKQRGICPACSIHLYQLNMCHVANDCSSPDSAQVTMSADSRLPFFPDQGTSKHHNTLFLWQTPMSAARAREVCWYFVQYIEAHYGKPRYFFATNRSSWEHMFKNGLMQFTILLKMDQNQAMHLGHHTIKALNNWYRAKKAMDIANDRQRVCRVAPTILSLEDLGQHIDQVANVALPDMVQETIQAHFDTVSLPFFKEILNQLQLLSIQSTLQQHFLAHASSVNCLPPNLTPPAMPQTLPTPLLHTQTATIRRNLAASDFDTLGASPSSSSLFSVNTPTNASHPSNPFQQFHFPDSLLPPTPPTLLASQQCLSPTQRRPHATPPTCSPMQVDSSQTIPPPPPAAPKRPLLAPPADQSHSDLVTPLPPNKRRRCLVGNQWSEPMSQPPPSNKVKRRTYLEVDYQEKDVAKHRGAKWDWVKKQWYVPRDTDLAPFLQWMPYLPNLQPVSQAAPQQPPPCAGPAAATLHTDPHQSYHKCSDAWCVRRGKHQSNKTQSPHEIRARTLANQIEDLYVGPGHVTNTLKQTQMGLFLGTRDSQRFHHQASLPRDESTHSKHMRYVHTTSINEHTRKDNGWSYVVLPNTHERRCAYAYSHAMLTSNVAVGNYNNRLPSHPDFTIQADFNTAIKIPCGLSRHECYCQPHGGSWPQ